LISFFCCLVSFCFINLRYYTGSLNPNIVKPLLLSLMVKSPPSSQQIEWLQARPIPIELSLTYLRFCFIFSSKKGVKSIFYLSSLIPIPVSIISTSRTNFLKPDYCKIEPESFSFIGKQVSTIRSYPWYMLNFTPFWTILKRISSKLSQSPFRSQ